MISQDSTWYNTVMYNITNSQNRKIQFEDNDKKHPKRAKK